MLYRSINDLDLLGFGGNSPTQILAKLKTKPLSMLLTQFFDIVAMDYLSPSALSQALTCPKASCCHRSAL